MAEAFEAFTECVKTTFNFYFILIFFSWYSMGVMYKKKKDILENEMPSSLSVSFPKMPCGFLGFLHSATYPVNTLEKSKEIFTSSGNYLVHHSRQ